SATQDPPAMLLHNGFRDREAEACTHVRGGFCLPVKVEDPIQMLLFDSRAGVFHFEPHALPVGFARHRYAAAFRREFDRIVQKIRKHLKKTVTIAFDHRALPWFFATQSDRLCPSLMGE